ncbi:MAG TPA: glycosyltransferase, partial [Polyangiaceae bacterium]|nr:glycosyltransferase [Polyangiaceae bacterium]
MQIVLLALYCTVLVLLCTYGAHRATLVFQCLRHKRRIERASRAIPVLDSALPRVTVQLPLYNEATVVRRLLDAVGSLDYPSDRLELQVLDDSTDETQAIARAAVEELCERGLNAVYVRRPD